MEDRRIPKKILIQNPESKRNLGRPQLRWRTPHIFHEEGRDDAWLNP